MRYNIKMKKDVEISAIIVHYGHGGEIFKCLNKLKIIKNKFKSVEFILVDNNDEKLEKQEIEKKYPWIKYYETSKNLGWGGGRNFGIKHASGKYIFSIDSDILIDFKSFKNLYNILKKNKETGMVSPRLLNISGKYHANATHELTPFKGVFFLSFINKFFPNNPVVKNLLMVDWNRRTSRYVDVLQLGAFMIRRKAYEEIGGFDEKIFLYFEENDVSNRLKKCNWKLFFDAKSFVTHLESKGTPKDSQRIKKVFAHSRFHYFKKHYGILSALAVEFFARISKESVILFSILALGTFLRFYRLVPNLIFNGEMGTDYMNVLAMIHGTRTWLIGPRTSHEWFFIPPLAYWMYIPILFLGNFKPPIINIFWAVVGSVAILVIYFYLKKLFDRKIALISSFLVAVSPSWIDATRASRYNAPAAILFLPYLYYLRESILDRGKSLFKLGLVLGFTMSFFPSPFLLIPATIVSFIFYKTLPKLKYILYFILGFAISNITFIIYEFSDKFAIIKETFIWIPYRILGFFGLYHKNTVSHAILSQNFYSIYQFFAQAFTGKEGTLALAIFLLIAFSTVYFSIELFRQRKKELAFYLVVISLLVSYIGLFVHGDPPEHYYYVIFPIPMILSAFILTKSFKNDLILTLITLLLGFCGIWYLITTNWFYQPAKPSFDGVQRTTDQIIKSSDGKTFSVARIGYNDQFDSNFANNYIYLLTIQGAKIDQSAKLKYTIDERNENDIKILSNNIK